MMKNEVNLELLLGKRVFSLSGRSVGRVEDVKAELRAGRCFVTEYHVGSYALFERLAALHMGRAILYFFRAKKKGGGYRVAWNQMDLSDPARPRLLCQVTALKSLFD